MKRGIFLGVFIAITIMFSLAVAIAASGNSGLATGAGNGDSSVSAANNKAASIKASAAMIRERVEEEIGARNISELKIMIAERKQKMEMQRVGMDKKEQKVYANQNAVRTAVHALLAVRNLTGGIGKNVSAIAVEFNNSVQNTIKAEAKIEKRSKIARIFFGGDDSAAEEIEANVEQNKLRIENMNQLMDNCNCSAEVKAVMQEQVQNMELEQARLKQVAKAEVKSKGILGWLFKR
ncbi:MAG: hypothetical protein V1886_02040 [archaeon]